MRPQNCREFKPAPILVAARPDSAHGGNLMVRTTVRRVQSLRAGAKVWPALVLAVAVVALLSAPGSAETSERLDDDIIRILSPYLYGREFNDFVQIAEKSIWADSDKYNMELPAHVVTEVPVPDRKPSFEQSSEDAELGIPRSHSAVYEEVADSDTSKHGVTYPKMKMITFGHFNDRAFVQIFRAFVQIFQWFVHKADHQSVRRSFINEYSHYNAQEFNTFMTGWVELAKLTLGQSREGREFQGYISPSDRIRVVTSWCEDECVKACKDQWFAESCAQKCVQDDEPATETSLAKVKRVWPSNSKELQPAVCDYIYRSPDQRIPTSLNDRFFQGSWYSFEAVSHVFIGDFFAQFKNFLNRLAKRGDGTVYAFSGAALGGTLAEVASLYMYEKYGMRCPTLNIGGPGGMKLAVKLGATPRREYYPWVAQVRFQGDPVSRIGTTVGSAGIDLRKPLCWGLVNTTAKNIFMAYVGLLPDESLPQCYSIAQNALAFSHYDRRKVWGGRWVPGSRVAYAEEINQGYPYDFAERVSALIEELRIKWEELQCKKTSSWPSFACSGAENASAYTKPLKVMKKLFVNRVVEADSSYFNSRTRDYDSLSLHFPKEVVTSVACASMVSSEKTSRGTSRANQESEIKWCACYEVTATDVMPAPIPALDTRAIHPLKESCKEFLSSSSKIVRRPQSPSLRATAGVEPSA